MIEPSGWIHKAATAVFQVPAWISLTLEGWRERHALERELTQLRLQGELDHTLADSGLSAGEMPRLLRAHPGAARQFGEMMHRFGIDRARLHYDPATAAAMREMEWTCGECRSWRACRAYLASPETGGHPGFCPNAAALAMLSARQHAERPQVSDPSSHRRSGILAELEARAGEYL